VWTQQHTITQSDGAAGDAFGYSVALSADGNTAIVGAYTADVGGRADQGSASVFTRVDGVWTQQQTLTQSDGAASDNFGFSVALSADGNTAIVGALFDDVSGVSNQGSASVFTRVGGVWTQQQTITQSDGLAFDLFGYSVALSADGNTAIVGAYFDDVGGVLNQGSVSVFARVGGVWTQQQTLTQSDGGFADAFGVSVALSADGNTAIVGAFYDDVGGRADQGSVSVFTRVGGVWTQQQTITQSDGAAGDFFGVSVAVSADGNTAIVGANSDAVVGGGADQGSASVFTRVGGVWTQQQTITQSDGAAGDRFGYSVALSADGTTTIVGAIGDDVGGVSDQGSATIFVSPLPGAPTGVSASSGLDAQSVVSWAAPAWGGPSPITGYTVTSQPGGQTCVWASGPLACTVLGLTNGTAYTFTVTATNAGGTSAASAASSSVTPTAQSGGSGGSGVVTPVKVKWTSRPSITVPLVATFSAAPGTSYRIAAALTKAAKSRRVVSVIGSCKVTGGKARCSIKLKIRGRWSVTITPKKDGSLGRPVKKTVKI